MNPDEVISAEMLYKNDILNITKRALERVLAFRGPVDDEQSEQAMWVEIDGVADNEYTGGISLRPLADAGELDAVQQIGDLTLVVPSEDCDRLRGATIDWIDDQKLGGGGLAIINPNKPPASISLPVNAASPAMGDRPAIDLSGPLEQQVIQVLEQQVNPSIAAHGGHSELVAIEGTTAYLRLSGGCQGCSMATVTLGEGISVAITEAIPEIENVVDVTDHSSGNNPYYEQAKK